MENIELLKEYETEYEMSQMFLKGSSYDQFQQSVAFFKNSPLLTTPQDEDQTPIAISTIINSEDQKSTFNDWFLYYWAELNTLKKTPQQQSYFDQGVGQASRLVRQIVQDQQGRVQRKIIASGGLLPEYASAQLSQYAKDYYTKYNKLRQNEIAQKSTVEAIKIRNIIRSQQSIQQTNDFIQYLMQLGPKKFSPSQAGQVVDMNSDLIDKYDAEIISLYYIVVYEQGIITQDQAIIRVHQILTNYYSVQESGLSQTLYDRLYALIADLLIEDQVQTNQLKLQTSSAI